LTADRVARQPPRGGLHPELSFPHTQEWELYHNGFSLCSKKVRVCLAELELPYRGHHVHLIETGAYETVRPAFLALNPAGTVPVLLHHGHPVYESHEQIAYVAAHSGAALLPADPALRTAVEHWTDCASLVGDPISGMDRRAGHCIPPLTFPLFATMVAYVPYREILRGLLTHPNKERPVFFALLKFRTVHGLPGLRPAMDALARARGHMATHLDALASHLVAHGGPWIAGEAFTLADVSWVVVLDRLVEADWDRYFWGDGRRPAIAAYWERLRSRASYRQAILAARTPVTERGIADLARAKADDAALRRRLEPPDSG
jgi:glutathione S-transferase